MEEQQQTLSILLHKIATERKLKNYVITTEATSTQGGNYTSVLFFAKISSDDNADINIFAKVANISENVRKLTPCSFFDVENLFYSDLIKTYKKLEEKHDVQVQYKYVIPEFYGFNFDYLKEVFALEDLTKNGYEMYDRFKTIDWGYTKEAMTQLARLHALSIIYSIESPDEFEEKTKTLTLQDNAETMMGFMNKMLNRIITCTKDENKSRVEKFLRDTATVEKVKSMIQPKNCVVLTHGDYRPNNLMHKLKEDGSYTIIPVDYQTLSRGNPLIDVMYFIFCGSDQKFRTKYFHRTLDHYYFKLSAALQRFHLDPDEVYPRKYFDEDLREALPYGLLISMMVLQLVTAEVDKVPVIDENDGLIDVSDDGNEECTRRVNEVIEDYIAMGVL